MGEYKVILDGIAAFVVEITCANGSRSVRRFPTEAAALMWIAEQGAIDAAAENREGCLRATKRLPRPRDPIALEAGMI
jgi:hypothetical protein